MNVLGRHLLVDFFDCDKNKIGDLDFVKKVMVDAAKAAGATIINDIFHQFSPVGVSGSVVIAESHLAIHTWPEHGFCAVDFFSCGDSVSPQDAFDHIKEAFSAAQMKVVELNRGIE